MHVQNSEVGKHHPLNVDASEMSMIFFYSSLGLAVFLVALSAILRSKMAFIATSIYIFFISTIVAYFGFGASLRKSAASVNLSPQEYQLFLNGIKAFDSELFTIKVWMVAAFGIIFVSTTLLAFSKRN